MIRTHIARRALSLTLGGMLLAGAAGATEFALRPLTPEVAAVRYRPRSDPPPAPAAAATPIVFQLHMGASTPAVTDGEAPSGFAGGFRVGPMIDPHVQVGLSLDWFHRSSETRAPIGPVYDLDGFPVIPEQVLARRSYDIVPLMGFLQITAAPNAALVPYFGIGGGYEWMSISETDETGSSYDAEYGAPAWQAWAGLAIPLGRHARLSGEAFYLGGEPTREVQDELGTYQERVDADMAGVRFGLSFGF
jgi:hypothetical protein